MIRERVAFAQPILSKLLKIGITARAAWLIAGTFFALGIWCSVAWFRFVQAMPEVALSIIAEVSQ